MPSRVEDSTGAATSTGAGAAGAGAAAAAGSVAGVVTVAAGAAAGAEAVAVEVELKRLDGNWLTTAPTFICGLRALRARALLATCDAYCAVEEENCTLSVDAIAVGCRFSYLTV